MRNESLENPNMESEQTPEEIRAVLEQAFNEGRHVDLVIDSLAGEALPASDLIVEEIDGQDLMITYLAEDGDAGELIPLGFNRIKRAVIRE